MEKGETTQSGDGDQSASTHLVCSYDRGIHKSSTVSGEDRGKSSMGQGPRDGDSHSRQVFLLQKVGSGSKQASAARFSPPHSGSSIDSTQDYTNKSGSGYCPPISCNQTSFEQDAGAHNTIHVGSGTTTSKLVDHLQCPVDSEPKCSDGVYRHDDETKYTGQITVSSGSSDYPQQTGEEVDGSLPDDCVWRCCLSNPGNHCYIIASVIALAHVYLSTSLLQMPRATMGDLGRGIVQLLQKQPRYILDLPIWKTLLENWPEIDRQQDAPELLTYLLLRVPRSEVGEWQARIQLADQQACDLVDHGHNIQPIRLVCAEVRMNLGISLQSCINAWCYDRGARHGFLHPPPAWLFFQLERFAVDSLSGLVHKTSWCCHIPSEPVSVPFFRFEQGLEVENELYMVFALVLHHGSTIQNGHYTTLLRQNDVWWHKDDHHKTTVVDSLTSQHEMLSYAILLRRC